jgi:hypothetical protein
MASSGFRGWRGDFYVCLGVTSWVGLTGTHVWLPFVHQFEGLADGRAWAAQWLAWRRPVSTGPHSVGDGPTVPGMDAQRRGWPHQVGGDREDVLCLPRVTAPLWMGARLVVVCSSRASLSLFEGCDVEEGRERVAKCQGMTLAIPHSPCTVSGMVAQ